MQFDVIPYGETAFLIRFEDVISLDVHLRVRACYEEFKKLNLKGVHTLIPAYNSLTVMYNPAEIDSTSLKVFLENTPFIINVEKKEKRIVEIPVCYEAPYALDMEFVCEQLGLTSAEVISLHTSEPYLIYMLGFSPGFMYLGGLDERLHISRKDIPRLKIPAGAVALADQQTGVYPLETPGGWQIIGQTPLQLFSKERAALAEMGDYIQFVAITAKEFEKLKQS